MRGWACLLAEKHAPGSSLGPTHIAVLRDQFKRLRDGDRFWYQNRMFAPQEVAALQSTRLSDILQPRKSLTTETVSSRPLDHHSIDANGTRRSDRASPSPWVRLLPKKGFLMSGIVSKSPKGVSINRAPGQCTLCILNE